LFVCLGIPLVSLADILVGVNGERLVGKVIEETSDTVVFESEIGGVLKIPRSRIRELQKTPANQSGLTNEPAPSAASATTGTNALWMPPGVGKDGFDWIQLKSDEWLKGHLRYVQQKKVQFESDKLEDLSLELKDVRQIYPSGPMFTKFYKRDQVFGTVVVSNDVVHVFGPEQIAMPRDELTGITPGGKREIEFWSGKANVGLTLQGGNTKQATFNAAAELARRTPATQFLLNYLGNFSEVNGEQNANNHRINLSYDVRLNEDWFLRPVQLEYYRDQLANIGHRVTAGVGVGYYLFDRDGLEWIVSAGPGYQYTRFNTVSAGDAESASTAAGTLQSRFKADITPRLTFIQTFSGTVASQEAGLYTHHMVSTLEFEVKHHLNLDVSFVWDYLQNPQTEASGVVPEHSDLRLTLGVGVKF
jgi:putative salt-induced outer membrane protein YdiY